MKNKIMKRTSVIVAIALAFGALDGTASAATLYAVTGTNTLLQFDSATPATITRLPAHYVKTFSITSSDSFNLSSARLNKPQGPDLR